MREHYFVGGAPVKLFRVMEKTKVYREGDDKHLATILLAESGRGGTIKVIDDEAIERQSSLHNGDGYGDKSISMYRFESAGILFGHWRILRNDKVVATASKPSLFSGRVRLRVGKESSWIYPGIFGGLRAYIRDKGNGSKKLVLLASFSRLWYNGLKYAFAVNQEEETQVSHMFAVFNSFAFVYLYRRKRMFRFIYFVVLISVVATFGLYLGIRLVYSWL